MVSLWIALQKFQRKFASSSRNEAVDLWIKGEIADKADLTSSFVSTAYWNFPPPSWPPYLALLKRKDIMACPLLPENRTLLNQFNEVNVVENLLSLVRKRSSRYVHHEHRASRKIMTRKQFGLQNSAVQQMAGQLYDTSRISFAISISQAAGS